MGSRGCACLKCCLNHSLPRPKLSVRSLSHVFCCMQTASSLSHKSLCLMRGLVRYIQNLFCLASDFLKTTTMPRATQNQSSGPKPVETNNTAAKHNPVQGTSKNDQELLDELLGFLDQRVRNDANPRRRESMKLCQNFVREHGYPVDNYYIYAWATHGIVRVLNEDESNILPNTVKHVRERYILVSCNEPNLLYGLTQTIANDSP